MAVWPRSWPLASEHALAHFGFINYYEIQHQSLILETERALWPLCYAIEVGFEPRVLIRAEAVV